MAVKVTIKKRKGDIPLVLKRHNTIRPDTGQRTSAYYKVTLCDQCGAIWKLQTNSGICPDCQLDAVAAVKVIRQLPVVKRKARRKTATKNDYTGLDGKWLTYLEVAREFEHKVPTQDRGDIRHDIMLELAKAQARKASTELSVYSMYRIASYMIADYWYHHLRLTMGLDCNHCSKDQRAECRKHDLYSQCKKLVTVLSLDTEAVTADGLTTTLRQTLPDDKAIDLDAWLDAKVWLLGCPTRLIAIANKTVNRETLTVAERKYLWKLRAREQKRLL